MTDPPTQREVRLSAIAAALCAVLIASALSYGIVHKVNQGDAIVRTAASEADQVERLNQQLDAQSKVATSERAALMAQNTALQREVNALVRYLRRHGITVPASVVNPPRSGTAASNRPKDISGPPSSGSHQGSPGQHPVTGSTITDLCTAVPMLCPMLPTLPPLGKVVVP